MSLSQSQVNRKLDAFASFSTFGSSTPKLSKFFRTTLLQKKPSQLLILYSCRHISYLLEKRCNRLSIEALFIFINVKDTVLLPFKRCFKKINRAADVNGDFNSKCEQDRTFY